MKHKRLKVTTWTLIFLAILAIYCVYMGTFETVATTAVAGILTVAMAFISSDGYRPSEKIS